MYPCNCEDKAIAKLKRHAKKMADEFVCLWELGDGEGGYVLDIIRTEFKNSKRELVTSYANRKAHE